MDVFVKRSVGFRSRKFFLHAENKSPERTNTHDIVFSGFIVLVL